MEVNTGLKALKFTKNAKRHERTRNEQARAAPSNLKPAQKGSPKRPAQIDIFFPLTHVRRAI